MYDWGHVKGEAAMISHQNRTAGVKMALFTCFATDVTTSCNFVSSKNGLVVHCRRRSNERERGRNIFDSSNRDNWLGYNGTSPQRREEKEREMHGCNSVPRRKKVLHDG